VASKKIGMKVTAERTKNKFMFREKNAKRNRNMKMVDKSRVNVKQMQIFGNGTNKEKLHS
jgi:hypothetical protein